MGPPLPHNPLNPAVASTSVRDLAERIKGAADVLAGKTTVVLPDFYVDRFVPVPDLDSFQGRVAEIHGRGGGNLPTQAQTLRVGGDAANTAYALARLGVPVRLIAHADPFGLDLLRRVLGSAGVDLEGVKPSERSASTVALEFEDGANVMLSDAGPLDEAAPDDLTDADRDAIRRADAVLFGNWSQARGEGAELLRTVLELAEGLTMLDTSDPTHRSDQDVRSLLDDDVVRRHLGVWAMNETEARHFARLAGGSEPESLEDAVRVLAPRLAGRLDAHTAEVSLSAQDDRVVAVRTASLEPRHRTGAGDAWNAGDLVGYLLGLDAADRLEVANAVAGSLLTSPDHRPPDLVGLAAWLDEHPRAREAAVTDL